MANVVVVGAQWGDEGKGKIVDWLSVSADVVVRFQGGHNAGHTLVIGDQVFKLALKFRLALCFVISLDQLLDRVHERLRHKPPAVSPEVPPRVGHLIFSWSRCFAHF